MKLVRPVLINADVLAYTNVPTAETAWNSGTTYAADAIVWRLNAAGQGRRWKSAQAGNSNHDPATDDGTWWEDAGATGPWHMYDDSVTTPTEHPDAIEVTLEMPASQRVNTLWLGNLTGTSVDVTVSDGTAVLYQKTHSLAWSVGINTWWEYFVEPITRRGELLITDLPGGYAGVTIAVTIHNPGRVAKCGALVAGLSRRLGSTRWNAQLGIKDYSRKEADEFGNQVIIERPFSNLGTFTAILDNAKLDAVKALLAQYRATPVLFIAHERFTSMALWGFARDFQIEVPGPDVSFCSLTIESLT